MAYPFFKQSRTIYWHETLSVVQKAHAEMTADRLFNPPGPIQWSDEHPSCLTSGPTGSQHDLKPGDCPHAWRINA
jgi:hypothetical protein